MKRLILSSVMLLALSGIVRAQEPVVRVVFHDGLVTIAATNALVSEVLSEWERVGGTIVKGLDRLPAERVTINLTGVHERTALDAVFGATGYVSSLRVDASAGKSLLSAVVVVPRSAGAAPAVRPAVDLSMPEARFEYPAPQIEVPDFIQERMQSAPPPPPRPATGEALLMPEIRFQYMDPRPAEPEPEAKPATKPEPKTKKPPSGR